MKVGEHTHDVKIKVHNTKCSLESNIVGLNTFNFCSEPIQIQISIPRPVPSYKERYVNLIAQLHFHLAQIFSAGHGAI